LTNTNNDPSDTKILDVFGFIFAILIPIVGFIIGVIVTLRHAPGRTNYGPAIIIASLLGALFWLAVGA